MRLLMNRLPLPCYDTAGEGNPGAITPSAADPAQGSADTWYGKAGVANEHHEWLASKQFADVNLALASHRSLEGLIGRQRLAVPQNDADAEAWNAIYKQVGRPETAEAYKLADGSKISGDEWKLFAPVFHEAGIGQRQAEKILGAYERRAGELDAAREVERVNEENRQIAALDKEWGSQTQANQDLAARAFRALGIDEGMSDKIEQAIGYQAMMKLFHTIGAGMGEAAFHQDGKRGSHAEGGTLAAAKSELQAKFDNKDFMAKYMNGDPRVRQPAIQEIETIQKRIADLTQGVR